ncbi:hypothetical protein Bhyg_13725 [Pseudolycoriella hygida]|uniref:Distal membrane-arm assembly complex protein 1-like domain-containing protein n=1 Tax=Pseudolycoriella hygida TaxID=35572 RepID=A0A9Q0RWL9_9DIPT|nr:hypothetical protein Bhyg_13725 [Pseudolycoriella hygida]
MKVIIPEPNRKKDDKPNPDSIVSKRHSEDCLPCRLVSGSGVVGIGGYIYSQAKHRPPGAGKNLIVCTALVTAYIGVARLVQIFPFGKK